MPNVINKVTCRFVVKAAPAKYSKSSVEVEKHLISTSPITIIEKSTIMFPKPGFTIESLYFMNIYKEEGCVTSKVYKALRAEEFEFLKEMSKGSVQYIKTDDYFEKHMPSNGDGTQSYYFMFTGELSGLVLCEVNFATSALYNDFYVNEGMDLADIIVVDVTNDRRFNFSALCLEKGYPMSKVKEPIVTKCDHSYIRISQDESGKNHYICSHCDLDITDEYFKGVK